MNDHYSQKPRRNAEFIKPPNMLKTKVGTGGLSEEILSRAQDLLENNTVDFQPLAEIYLSALQKGIDFAASSSPYEDQEYIISRMLYPAMQLKANGGMFHYPLITRISDKLIQFLEVIEAADVEAIEIVMAFHTTIRAVVMGRVSGDGGRHGTDLLRALNEACLRYFEKHGNSPL